MRVCLDPGHGGWDSGAKAVNGGLEKVSNLRVTLVVADLLKVRGLDVILTRSDDRALGPGAAGDIDGRCALANREGADVFLSIHADAANGPDPHGHHAIYSLFAKPGQGGALLARFLVDEITRATGRDPFPRGDRGCWTRESERYPGRDYYGVIRGTHMPAVIIERGFLTNPTDADLLFAEEHLKKQAEGIARAICRYADVAWDAPAAPPAPPSMIGTPVLGRPQTTVEQAQAWARIRGASQWFVDLAPIYWRVAAEIAAEIGDPEKAPRPEVAYSQAAKETRFGHFGGVVPGPEWHNPCGMKKARGGGNYDPDAHMQFASDEEGVRAHMDHLALYAGAPGYPRAVTPDPRHVASILGAARMVEELGGENPPDDIPDWAPSPDYGPDIVRLYLLPLLAVPAPVPSPPPVEDPELARLREENAELKARLAQIAELAGRK